LLSHIIIILRYADRQELVARRYGDIPEVLEADVVAVVDDVVADDVAVATAAVVVVTAVAGMMTGSTRSSGARSGSCDQFCLLRALIEDCNSDTSVAYTIMQQCFHRIHRIHRC